MTPRAKTNDIPRMHGATQEQNKIILKQIRTLLDQTAPRLWKKPTFAELLQTLDIPGLTAPLAKRLSTEIKSHLKNHSGLRAKEHLVELIEEQLNAWGLLAHQPSRKKHQPPAEDSLSHDLLGKLTQFRYLEKLSSFITPAENTSEKHISYPQELMDQWTTLVGLNDDASPLETFDRISQSLALKERAYQPDCALAACKEKFLNTLLNPALFLSPLILKNLNAATDLSEATVLAAPRSVDESFEALKIIAAHARKKLPLGIYLGELPPSSDHFRSPSLSGEVIPFVQSLLSSSRPNSPLRVSIQASHPDIVGFINLVPQMALQAITPTIIVDKPFLQALFQNESWTPQYRGQPGHSLNLKDIVEKLIRSIVDYGYPELQSMSSEALGHLTPAFSGGLLSLPNTAPLLAHLNLNDLTLNKSDFWDHARELLNHTCHLLDNAAPSNNSRRHFIFNLYGLSQWIEAQGMQVQSSKALDQLERLFSFFKKELMEISAKMAGQRGGIKGQRFSFNISCFEDDKVSHFFTGHPFLPAEILKNTSAMAQIFKALGVHAGTLSGTQNNPTPNETLKAIKTLSECEPLRIQFRVQNF